MFLDYGQSLTSGWEYSGAEVACNVIAALLMLATAVLAIGYTGSRKASWLRGHP